MQTRVTVIRWIVHRTKNAMTTAPDEIDGMNRDQVLTEVVGNGALLERYKQTTYSADKAIVLAAVTNHGVALQYASKDLQCDREIVLAAVNNCGDALRFASRQFKICKDIVLVALRTCSEYRIDEIVDEADLYTDRDVVMAVVTNDGSFLPSLAEEFRADKEIVVAAVNSSGEALQHASTECSSNVEIVLTAVSKRGSALQYASKELQSNKEVVLAAIGDDCCALEFASPELRANREVVKAACKEGAEALAFASSELLSDRQFVAATIQQACFEGDIVDSPDIVNIIPGLKAELLLIWEELHATVAQDSTVILPSPKIFADQWSARLWETRWCLNQVAGCLPKEAAKRIVEFSRLDISFRAANELEGCSPILAAIVDKLYIYYESEEILTWSGIVEATNALAKRKPNSQETGAGVPVYELFGNDSSSEEEAPFGSIASQMIVAGNTNRSCSEAVSSRVLFGDLSSDSESE